MDWRKASFLQFEVEQSFAEALWSLHGLKGVCSFRLQGVVVSGWVMLCLDVLKHPLFTVWSHVIHSPKLQGSNGS